MKYHYMKRTLFVGLLSLLFFSCERDAMVESEDVVKITKKELLTNNKWIVQDVKTGGASVLPLITRLQCITDNVLTFEKDGSFVIDEGANVCSPAFAGSGTWSLVENDTKIKWSFTAPQTREVLVPIIELTGTTLRISYHFEDEVPVPGTYEMVLKKY